MCGRYSIQQVEQLPARYGVDQPTLPLDSNNNARPTQTLPIVAQDTTGVKHLEFMRWGLIPSWSKDMAIGSRLINARAETVAEKPSFRSSFKKMRCLIPADGFYEWREEGSKKRPYCFTLKDKAIFSFAGLYSVWSDIEGNQLKTYTIITTTSNDLLQTYHNRMPVILLRELEEVWLNAADNDPSGLLTLLTPYDSKYMEVMQAHWL
ncbi:MAG: SOS response-associated peptidase [Chloroflexi bacterium AL-W]|nr:SOS response-associated peptidase [Chloroflexi bacterium AL-N1]NOK67469.1 SOS response-associated peptidase [Chloroflexi bacterium AL-N10]NOK75039.1 SOS response-associated peptidase [Chloroflexi bacterium AL-N5]NOK81826.1 SOS response-associated peptidase [Chloroflexi bacterium AL-W]NOK89672.1 SOS response-associated peptidase [Chloroflexi bacterium AL-N15]